MMMMMMMVVVVLSKAARFPWSHSWSLSKTLNNTDILSIEHVISIEHVRLRVSVYWHVTISTNKIDIVGTVLLFLS